MAENKTHATSASVDEFIAAIPDEGRRKDCLALVAMMLRVTGCTPCMFGATLDAQSGQLRDPVSVLCRAGASRRLHRAIPNHCLRATAGGA